LFNSQITLAKLRADHSIKIKDVRAVERVFYNRHKLHRAATLAKGFLLSAKCGVD
jgi:hypothetical protein